MWDLIQWLDLKSALRLNQEALAQNASSIVLIAYCVGYIINRKSALIGTFLLCEFMSVSSVLDELSNINYYLFHAGIYLCLYWWLTGYKLIKNKQLLTCFLVALLSLGMALDAHIYKQDETLFYKMYEHIFVVVHCLFILSFINIKRIRNNARNIFSYCVCILGYTDDHTFNFKDY